MAYRERYERDYAGAAQAVLLKAGNVITVEFTGIDATLAPGLDTVTNAQKQVDQIVGRGAVSEWRRVLECHACLARPVKIEPVPERDASTVSCPNCGTYTITGPAAMGAHALHDTLDGRARIADVARHLHATADQPNRDSLSTDSFAYFEQEGRRLRPKE